MRGVLAILVVLSGGIFAMAQDPSKKAVNPAVEASNAFACDLFKALNAENAGKNLFFSPYSISSALAMTLDGARGDTALEMGQVLRLPESLRQATPNEPWATGLYNSGFADFNRQLTTGGDTLKTDAIRKQLVDLRTQLADVNKQIQVQQDQGKFQTLGALTTQANKLANSINTLAKQVDQYELKVANAIWGQKGFPFKKDYVEDVDKYFGSGHLRDADFANDFAGERAKINRWVEEQTADRIKDLIPKLPPEEARRIRMVLVNAIYFKGEWSQPFDEKRTTTDDFTLAAGEKRKTKMMHHLNKDARYAAFNGDGSTFTTPQMIGFDDKETSKYPGKDGFLVAEIPVKGDKLSMVLIAPQSPQGLDAIEKKLTGETLTTWLGKLQKRSVNIAMPKFKMETDYALGDTLQKMGMKKAFQERIADFTAMAVSTNPDDRLYISRVLHKAFVDVNEKGAEAAAATAVMMAVPTSAPRAFPFIPEFNADRPFLFMIRDVESGMILFIGRMNQPTSENKG